MLCEEDQQLFMAARRAQVNRNTAIHVFDTRRAEAAELLRGGVVRVLLELPATHDEDYAIARVTGTVEGAPYRGFSTNSNQETSMYLVLSLPRQLAELNGEQFQLNSISNSAMNEAEFSRWLAIMRSDQAALPTIAELEEVARRVQPLDSARRPAQGSRVHRGGGGNNANSSASTLGGVRPGSALVGGGAAAGVARPGGFGAPNVSTGSIQTEMGGMGAFAWGAGNNNTTNGNNVSAPMLPHIAPPQAQTQATGPSGIAPMPPPRTPSPGGVMTADAARLQRQLARQGTTLGRNSNMPDGGYGADGNVGNLYGGGGGGGVALQTSTPAANSAPSTEDAEMERRLRQEVLNQLQSNCTLFPRECSAYKLSQLRTTERDMDEFLRRVQEEIARKQSNCVVCMDHQPTVIMLPCRHKALCRLCAAKQSSCPLCRKAVTEMFEPLEI